MFIDNKELNNSSKGITQVAELPASSALRPIDHFGSGMVQSLYIGGWDQCGLQSEIYFKLNYAYSSLFNITTFKLNLSNLTTLFNNKIPLCPIIDKRIKYPNITQILPW